MAEQTQKERVIEKLNRDGQVDNFWAINNYILRLGAIIFELKREGRKFNGYFGKQLGYNKSVWKNFYYIEQKDIPSVEMPPAFSKEHGEIKVSENQKTLF